MRMMFMMMNYCGDSNGDDDGDDDEGVFLKV